MNSVSHSGTFGALECTNLVEKLGRISVKTSFCKMNWVLSLSIADELLSISSWGKDSVSVNTHVNAQLKAYKLILHTPDKDGKSKGHFLYTGKNNTVCPFLQVHGTQMERVIDSSWLSGYRKHKGN